MTAMQDPVIGANEKLKMCFTDRNLPVSAFSNDGNYCAYSAANDSIVLMDIRDRSIVQEFKVRGKLNDIAFSGDQERIAAAGFGKVFVWEIDNSTSILELDVKSNYNRPKRVGLNHDGSLVLFDCSLDDDSQNEEFSKNGIWVADVGSKKILHRMELTENQNTDAFLLSPSDNLLVAEVYEPRHFVGLWDVMTGGIFKEFPVDEGAAWAFAFSKTVSNLRTATAGL